MMSQHALFLRLVWVPNPPCPILSASPTACSVPERMRRTWSGRPTCAGTIRMASRCAHQSVANPLSDPHMQTSHHKGDKAMTTRLNAHKVTPNGVAALVNVENYLKSSGLDHRLLALIKTRV